MRQYIYGIAYALKIGIAWYDESPDGDRLMTCHHTATNPYKFLLVAIGSQAIREDVLQEWNDLQRDVVRASWASR